MLPNIDDSQWKKDHIPILELYMSQLYFEPGISILLRKTQTDQQFSYDYTKNVGLVVKFYELCRTSHLRSSNKKDVLKNFANVSGKQLYQSLFFQKVAGLRPATLFKEGPWRRCFPVNTAKVLRTPFLHRTYWRLLLALVQYQKRLKSWHDYNRGEI